MKRAILLFMALVLCVSFFGCTSEEGDELQSISISPNVSASFECTVTLESVEPKTGGDRAVFKSTIGKGDLALSGALVGKTVKSVAFIDPYHVEVVLTGKSTALQYDVDYGKITVSKNALENDCDSFGVVIVEKAYIRTESSMANKTQGNYMATFVLAAGSFTEQATAEHVRVAPGSTGTLELVTLEDGKLVVRVTGAASCPLLEIDPEVTSFQKSITIEMTTAAKVILE